MREKCASPDLLIAEVAARQYGVVSTRQLTGAGIGKDGVLRRAKAGRLHRVHQGVYAVGHAGLSAHGRWMAAVLACGRPGGAGRGSRGACDDGAAERRSRSATMTVLEFWGATLSHRSAAVHWGLLPSVGSPVDISVPGDGGKAKRRGIRLHRCTSLLPADVTLHRGIPVTTPVRTIADLRRAVSAQGERGLISPKELRRAIRQADVLGLPIGVGDDRDRTRSDLERDFLRICRRHCLPAPEVNVRIGRHLVDFLWRDRMLVVETDGYRYHRGRTAFEDDRSRDLELRASGFEVIRLGEKQVGDDAQRVAEVVGAALRVRADG